MCGIAGIITTGNVLDNFRESTAKMISALQHRGPDGWGLYTAPGVSLGHTRLSIIDLGAGHQPMMTERYVVSFNGEIFNYIELRDELIKQGTQFRTSSDTEVILKVVEAYGLDAFSKFNGQFALLIWDKVQKRLIVARDRYGIRPLYILNHGKHLYFSSELKCFDTISGYQRKIDPEMLFQHALLWNTLGDKTIYEHIRSLPPGTIEVHGLDGSCTRKRYYEIGETLQKPISSLNEAIDDFKEVFEDAVRLRLRSDVPVVTYLSGGIDSSITTYLVSKIMGTRLHSFSVAFEDKEFDESKYQLEMANTLHSSHFKLDISYTDIESNMLEAAYHFERPVFRTAGVPLFLLSKKVNDAGIKVVITGEGADEVLCGYDSFKEMKLLNFWRSQPNSIIRPQLLRKLNPHLSYFNNPKQYGLMRIYYEGFLESHTNSMGILNIRIHNNQILSNFFNKDYKLKIETEKLEQDIQHILPNNYNEWTLLQKSQFLEMKTLLSGYLLSSQGDRMSMAHSVEGRYPFLDHRVVEKAFHYKDAFKLNGFSQKHLLKEAYKSCIPDSIIERPKKPYTAPDLKAFASNGKLSKSAQYFLSPQKIKDFGIFDDIAITRYLKKFQRPTPQEIGYRDNMLFTFILSTQMISYWIQEPKQLTLPIEKKKVDITEQN